jgi:cytoskeletal protein RodZ
MKRIVLTYGLIAGVIVGSMILITMPMYQSGTLNFDNGELLGYTTMTIALSLIFFGIKTHRDKNLSGEISFWKATQVGLLIMLVAGVVYALSWEVSYRNIGEEFTAKMTQHYIDEMKEDGATEQELAEAKARWESFGEMYKNPIVRFGVTVMEITPVGVILTLLSAALLSRRNFLPAENITSTPS